MKEKCEKIIKLQSKRKKKANGDTAHSNNGNIYKHYINALFKSQYLIRW